jgi:hypothetical protein
MALPLFRKRGATVRPAEANSNDNRINTLPIQPRATARNPNRHFLHRNQRNPVNYAGRFEGELMVCDAHDARLRRNTRLARFLSLGHPRVDLVPPLTDAQLVSTTSACSSSTAAKRSMMGFGEQWNREVS